MIQWFQKLRFQINWTYQKIFLFLTETTSTAIYRIFCHTKINFTSKARSEMTTSVFPGQIPENLAEVESKMQQKSCLESQPKIDFGDTNFKGNAIFEDFDIQKNTPTQFSKSLYTTQCSLKLPSNPIFKQC